MESSISQSHDDQSRQPLIIVINVLLMVVLVTTIILRIFSRTIARVGLWWDDWFALAGTPFAMLPLIFDLVSLKYGFGKHADTLALTTVSREGFMVYILQLFYNISLGFFKFSFLALYVRVFPQRWMRLACCCLGAIILCWLVSTEFALIFRCKPIRASWEGPSAGTCSPQDSVLLAQSIPTIIFDLVILCLPMIPIWRLQMPKSARFAVIGIFLMGGLVTVISIARIVIVMRLSQTDLTWNFVDLGFLSATEPVAGLVCCSLSTFAPLFKMAQKWFGHVSGSDQSNLIPSGANSSRHAGKKDDAFVEASRPHRNRGYERHYNDDTVELREFAGSNSAYADHRLFDAESGSRKNPDKDNIHVRQDVSVSFSKQGR